MKNKLKVALNWVANILIVLIFVVAIFVFVGTINKVKTGVSSVFGYTANSVQSDSMSGTFEKGDIVIGKIYNQDRELEKEEIITYKTRYNGQIIVVTHRIKDIQRYENGSVAYVTQGDNELAQDRSLVAPSDIIAVYTGKISGVGVVVDWIKTPFGFILVVVTPILIFIGYQVYKIILILNENKKAQAEKTVITSASEASDEVKDAIIKEYLEKMKKEESNQENKSE